MSPQFRLPTWLWLVLIASTIASLWVGVERHRGERAHRAVHLVADLPDLQQIAAVTGRPVAEVMRELQLAGLTGVAVAEDNFEDLLASGSIVPVQGSGGRFYCGSRQLFERLRSVFKSRFRAASGPTGAVLLGPGGEQLSMPAPPNELKGFGLGFDAETCSLIVSSGLTLVARIGNPPISTRAAIDDVVSAARLAGAQGVIFSGDQVLGRRDLVPFAATVMKANDLWYGMVEFSNQGGVSRMLKEMLGNTLRVHSMVAAEIDRADIPDIVDRYVRAVVERNIKVCFLRPVSWAADDPLASLKSLVASVATGIRRQGYEPKIAFPAYPENRPPWAALLASIGIAATATWLAGRFLSRKVVVAVGLVFVVAAVGAYFGVTGKYMALLGAVTFPTWAILAALSAGNSGGGARKWIAAYFWITAISVLGGLHVAAILTELPYMIRLEQFFGVKAAHFVPPILVGGYILLEQFRLATVMETRVRWFDMAVLGAALLAFMVMLMRTGNDAPGDVSSLELKVRTLLDRFLPERPRTKEFLVGHPALVLALSLAFQDRRRFMALAGFAAAIGQASVLNTFCHIHTPIAVSAMRVLTGLLVGGLVGLCALAVLNLVERRAR
jgi:hypothetical protein